MPRLFYNMALLACLFVNLSGCQSISKNEPYIGYSTFTETDGWQIWKLNLKTKQTQQLTWSKNEAYYPSFGPAGELAYNDHNGRIWFVKSNVGEKNKEAELLAELPKYCGHPAISPDGLSLACVCFNFINRSEDSDLYLVNLQNGKSKRLKTLPGIQKHPAWSPEGSQLVFNSGYRELGDTIVEQLWIMDLSNQVPIKIVDNGYSNINPVWSPDGQQIAYSSDVNGSLDIWLYDIESKKSHSIVNHKALDADPLWRGEQSHVVFLSTREGAMGLWEVDLSSKQEKKLLMLKEDIHEPVWMGQ